MNSRPIILDDDVMCILQAVTAFLWFGFAAFVASTVITGFGIGGGVSRRSTRGPQMSKV